VEEDELAARHAKVEAKQGNHLGRICKYASDPRQIFAIVIVPGV
jgi:hypothetical protein